MAVAILLTAAGVICLYGSWKRWTLHRTWWMTSGWVLLVSSSGFWIRATGAEFGTTLALLVPALVAWYLASRNSELRQRRNRRPKSQPPSDQPPEQKAVTTPGSAARHVLLFLVTVPLSAVAAIFVSIAVARGLPWSDVNEMVLAVLVMPVLWGCAAYWAVAATRLVRPVLTILISGGISAAFLYL